MRYRLIVDNKSTHKCRPIARNGTHEQPTADIYDLEHERSQRIIAIEAAQVESGLRYVLQLRDDGLLSDEELLGIWGRGL